MIVVPFEILTKSPFAYDPLRKVRGHRETLLFPLRGVGSVPLSV